MHATIDITPLIVRILAMPEDGAEGMLGCGEVFALLDEFTDRQAAGEDMGVYHPLVYRHLRVCPSCLEEYEALLTMIALDAGEN
jgi:hypothetical protein